ncbi:hypothetical protein [Kitasatospora acidiphila]|uniref:hypothetical protein n=1 Tax=Kitasatospora acidiphila TaxID=2567942 RepID=UPI003C74397D
MPTVAVTGHMDLAERTAFLVRAALRELLAEQRGPLVGISCLAPGADSLFAEAVLEAHGSLLVVLPSRDYRAAQVRAAHAQDFDRLLTSAEEVVVLPFETAGREAYEAANKELVRRADLLVAVWDGSAPSGNGGGTADAVQDARDAGVPVRVVWPEHAARG